MGERSTVPSGPRARAMLWCRFSTTRVSPTTPATASFPAPRRSEAALLGTSFAMTQGRAAALLPVDANQTRRGPRTLPWTSMNPYLAFLLYLGAILSFVAVTLV